MLYKINFLNNGISHANLVEASKYDAMIQLEREV